MVNNLNVSILLSTYNGSKYILEQLESLRLQSFSDFTLYVRDDGSSDDTLELIKNYKGLDVVILEDSHGNVRPAKSYLHMLSEIESDVYFFCDQDDYWFPDKIYNTLKMLESVEDISKTPILVHTELELVDQNLNKLGSNFHEADGVNPTQFIESNKIYVENCVVGCTSAFNRAARDICIENFNLKFDFIAMHDWWVALCVRNCGRIYYDNNPSISYRQHSSNVSGSSYSKKFTLKSISLERIIKVRTMKLNIIRQLETYQRVFLQVRNCKEKKLVKKIFKSMSRDNFYTWITLFYIGVRFSRAKLNISVLLLSFLPRTIK